MDDYPNDGEQMTYPKEAPLVQEEADLKTTVDKSYPILQDIIDWFEKEIALADSIDNIETKTLSGVKYSRTVSVEAQVLAQQLLKGKLQESQTRFIRFKEDNDTAKS